MMMMQRPLTSRQSSGHRPVPLEESLRLSRTILHCANRGLPKARFWQEVSEALLEFSGCDAVEIRLSHDQLCYCCHVTHRPQPGVRFELAQWTIGENGVVLPAAEDGSDLERICRCVASQRFDSGIPCFTANGSFWISDAREPLSSVPDVMAEVGTDRVCVGGHYRSLAIIRFEVDERTVGLLHLKSEQPDFFPRELVEFFEGVAQTLGLAVASQRAQAALRERVKELTCLYRIAQAVETGERPLSQILKDVVALLPPAWQYPEIIAARITLDALSYLTPGFRDTPYMQSADVVVAGRCRGAVELVYLEERPEFAVGAFLSEEEHLINAVAREVSLIVERRETQAERARLREQLIHADRLATIGELAAGVAHELNEPLGSILGFAQLAEKSPDLPAQPREDMERIVKASLYAREVIKKLLVFARQMPPTIASVSLNRVVEDGLYFLEARCAKAGIEVERNLAVDLPKASADPSQLNQVLVNLVVNAIQAMPEGGRLMIRTREDAGSVLLIVIDSGIGMSEEVADKIFLPFFSTKDVDQGTGLGLAVVHGIVTAHGGTIDVESKPGGGSRFTVRLPAKGPQSLRKTPEDGNKS